MAIEDDSSRDDRIAEEAAGWVARLQSSDATEGDRAQFQAWLGRDDAHQSAFEEFQTLWADLKQVSLPSERQQKRRLSNVAKVGNAVGLCVVIGLSASLYRMGFVDRFRADHYTTVGEVRSLTLEDGTRVALNTDTAIAIRFSDGERRVELLRGEAFFDVAANPEKPFLVADDDITATAIGTRFGIRTATSGLASDVQVQEGRVEVRSSNDNAMLKAGETASLSADGALSVEKADVANAVAWKDGHLVFSGQPLRDVLATLERYRPGNIAVLGEDTAQLRVSGVFNLNDTDDALRVLEQNLPVRVTYLTGALVLVRAR